MHPYIPHLLTDITNAHRKDIPEEDYPQSLEAEFEEIEKWVSGKQPEYTFGYYCGLKSVDFPPPEQLTNNEMKLIRKAFEKMMYTWNHGIDLPKIIPADFAYKLIVDTLNKKTSIVNSGSMSFDFCTGYAPGCELKEYCPCLEIWNNCEAIDNSKTQNFKLDDEENENGSKHSDDNEIPF